MKIRLWRERLREKIFFNIIIYIMRIYISNCLIMQFSELSCSKFLYLPLVSIFLPLAGILAIDALAIFSTNKSLGITFAIFFSTLTFSASTSIVLNFFQKSSTILIYDLHDCFGPFL